MNKWFGLLVFNLLPALALASGVSDDIAVEPKQGRAIYEQHCAACHGWQGEGAVDWEKPDEQGEMPPPPHDETGHTWRHSDAMLLKMIAEGWRHPFNKSDRLTMPAFEDSLTDQEIRAIIEYLRRLWTDEQRLYQQSESQGVADN